MHFLIQCSLVLATFFVSINAQLHGFDISTLEDVLNAGWSFQDLDGVDMPLEQILINHGMELVRLRVFTKKNHLKQQLKLAQRVTQIKPNMKFLLNLHLSDNWTNPTKQVKPAAWKDLEGEDLEEALRSYVHSTLLTFWNANITVDTVSIGNETPQGILFPDGQVTQNNDSSWSFDNFNKLWLAGRAGVDAFKSMTQQQDTPRVMLHINNGWQTWPETVVSGMTNAEIAVPKETIDVVGLSMYSVYWAKKVTLEGLEKTILGLDKDFGIPSMVVETSWPIKCTRLDQTAFQDKWPTMPMSPVGQKGWVRALLDIFKNVSEELRPKTGVIWWEPAYMTNKGVGTKCEDMLLFEEVELQVARARESIKIFEKLRAETTDQRSYSTDQWDFDWSFSGIETFAHLPHVKCLTHPDEAFDIAIIGAPFDTAVTFRPGARFGPRAIRHMSQRQTTLRGFNAATGINPYKNWAKIIDCGDIPITPFDNAVALKQMTLAFEQLIHGPTAASNLQGGTGRRIAKDGSLLPRLLTLGGDHSIALPALAALHKAYGPVSVLHFDSHLDTWSPAAYPQQWASETTDFTHGTMFHLAAQRGYIANGTSVHAGLRTRLSGADFDDYMHDQEVGFKLIEAREMDSIGADGIAANIMNVLGKDRPVYLSIDIDVLDPSVAPGTGTPESGGWTTREMLRVLQALQGLNIVGADIVEVSPAHDNQGETTALAAADLAFEILGMMVQEPGFQVDAYIAPKQFVGRKAIRDEKKSCLGCSGEQCACKEGKKACCKGKASKLEL
ncbi:arginase family-domain-containing protein [Protomyces lactucae-debilis]|uniref:Arabinogalactan endo-beta-1,4-galactanase n=1 Tax=Protomyces lactucae-debilis TaxID=2754530 RepID=A0A1Y2F5F4_PROLT|nr:arginase family-domain-containing protein [Protomyces lactucae-debilis]ORY78576.1 arginase family-domain-containing protein [Protomyces lactucae-debilis]